MCIGNKEILIKSVAQAIPTYVMSIFKLPASVCDDLTLLGSRKRKKEDDLAHLGQDEDSEVEGRYGVP